MAKLVTREDRGLTGSWGGPIKGASIWPGSINNFHHYTTNMLFFTLLTLPTLIMSPPHNHYHIHTGGSITCTATGAYICACTSMAPYLLMRVVQEHTEEAGKNRGDKLFSNLGLGDFVWVQVIQTRVMLDTSSYHEASPNLYSMLLCRLEDCATVKIKNVSEECAIWYLVWGRCWWK